MPWEPVRGLEISNELKLVATERCDGRTIIDGDAPALTAIVEGTHIELRTTPLEQKNLPTQQRKRATTTYGSD
jgi:hypothetical protein